MLEIRSILEGDKGFNSPVLQDFAHYIAQRLPDEFESADPMAQATEVANDIMFASFDVKNNIASLAEDYPDLQFSECLLEIIHSSLSLNVLLTSLYTPLIPPAAPTKKRIIEMKDVPNFLSRYMPKKKSPTVGINIIRVICEMKESILTILDTNLPL